MAALAGMMAYGQAMADDRRADPRDDIVSRIVTAEVDGERLTDTEFQMFWLLLVVAGNETTRNAVSGSVIALHEHGLWSWLADHPEHLPTAVEELLRYVSPVQHFRRTATSDTVLGDQQVRAGDKVVIWFGAANRDPAVFADPHRLDLRRDPNPHVAFGVGPHFCLGAHLARLEASEMLRDPPRARTRHVHRHADPDGVQLHQRRGPPPGAGGRADVGLSADDDDAAAHAVIDDDRIAGIEVDPRVLPWEACPGAVASAQRVLGVQVDDLARHARTELVGVSTCTHLTSTIRCLADVRALARLA